MVETTMTAGVLAGMGEVTSAFSGLLALAISLGLGLFAVVYLIAQVRASRR